MDPNVLDHEGVPELVQLVANEEGELLAKNGEQLAQAVPLERALPKLLQAFLLSVHLLPQIILIVLSGPEIILYFPKQ